MFIDALKEGKFTIERVGLIVKAFLERMTDSSKRVQRAACGAFTPYLISYLHLWRNAIMQTFQESFSNYRVNNFGNLMDVVVNTMQAMARWEQRRLIECEMNWRIAQSKNDQQTLQLLQQERIQITNTSVQDPKVIDALIQSLIPRWLAFEKDFDSNSGSNGSENGNNNNSEEKNKEFASNEFDKNIYPVFEGLTQIYWNICEKALKLCVDVKIEIREWDEMLELARKESGLDIHSNSDGNSNNNGVGKVNKYVRYINGKTITIVNKY